MQYSLCHMTAWYPFRRARAIGVSNFEIQHLQELQEQCSISPMVNQVRTPAKAVIVFYTSRQLLEMTHELAKLPECPLMIMSSCTHGSKMLNHYPPHLCHCCVQTIQSCMVLATAISPFLVTQTSLYAEYSADGDAGRGKPICLHRDIFYKTPLLNVRGAAVVCRLRCTHACSNNSCATTAGQRTFR